MGSEEGTSAGSVKGYASVIEKVESTIIVWLH